MWVFLPIVILTVLIFVFAFIDARKSGLPGHDFLHWTRFIYRALALGGIVMAFPHIWQDTVALVAFLWFAAWYFWLLFNPVMNKFRGLEASYLGDNFLDNLESRITFKQACWTKAGFAAFGLLGYLMAVSGADSLLDLFSI